MSPPTPTPTPMPMLAPVDRPLDSVPVSVSEVVGATSFRRKPFCLRHYNHIVRNLTREQRNTNTNGPSRIWMGCAHIVTGPMTCVLSDSTWRTVTMVDDELGKPFCLRHYNHIVRNLTREQRNTNTNGPSRPNYLRHRHGFGWVVPTSWRGR
jgi:hypothetical protein